ncbi:MAG: G5 domain-containing protein [Acidimicrobiia bacterium]|nr:G5 domain-containing protein [Acidimicrobiia bacterium]
MHEHHPRATHRRASQQRVATPARPHGRAHPAPAVPRRRLSHQARAALARARLLEIDHEPAQVCLVSRPHSGNERPVRLIRSVAPAQEDTAPGCPQPAPQVAVEPSAATQSTSARRARLAERRARAQTRRRVLLTVVLVAGLAALTRPALTGGSGSASQTPVPAPVAAPSGAPSVLTEARAATAVAPPAVAAVVATDLAIPPPVEIVDDPGVYRGDERTLTEGHPGTRRDTYEVTTRDGAEVDRVLIGSQILVAPQSRIVAIGTKAPRDDSRATGRVRVAPAGWQPEGSALGRATWYQYKSGTCAHNTLPKGTLVRVTNLADGRSTMCVVADRGIRDPSNLIDLAHDVFDDLAPRSQGVVHARIEW